jgi:hypothetical protein
MRFSLGVNYLPRRSGFEMWRRFDAGEIRDDFAHIAALGLDTVRVFLRWSDFQPEPGRADDAMLARFETLLGCAAEAGLRALPTLFCGRLDGANDLPGWALDRTGAPSHDAGDLYRDPLLAAQLGFARTAGARVRDHAALFAWDIGNAFSRVREPSRKRLTSGEHSTEPADERDIAAWASRLAEALRESSGRPSTAGTDASDLTEDRGVRFGTLCARFSFASMQGDTVSSAFARNRLDPEAVPFLAALTASFSYKPVLVTAFGNPTCPPGKFTAFERFARANEAPNVTISPDDGVFATYPCLSEDENAAYATNVLERLQADGRLGAFWWRWSDFEALPPGDAHAGSYGIVRADGSEKPVAAALAAFAAQGREVAEADDMTMIAAAYYYRTLPTSTRTLYEAFLRFTTERRANRAQVTE